MCVAFAKLLTFCSKNINVFKNTFATIVNEFAIYKLVKLTMLWTTGPRIIRAAMSESLLSKLCPVKIQIRQCIYAVWSDSSQGTFWTDKDAKFLHEVYKDSGDAQADLSLCRAHTSEGMFSHSMRKDVFRAYVNNRNPVDPAKLRSQTTVNVLKFRTLHSILIFA